MKIQLSERQVMFLAGNAVIASSLVVLPQSLIDLALQNTWIIPIFIFLYVYILFNISLFGVGKLKSVKNVFSDKNKKNWGEKLIVVLFLIFIVHVVMRDLRVLSGFVETTLLPSTPLFAVTLLIIVCCTYIAWAGMEVVARFTELHFIIFIGIILFVPISLAGEIKLENFEPVLGMEIIPSLLSSSFIAISWFGESIVLLLIINMIAAPVKRIKWSFILGTTIGIALFSILLFTQIGVLGAEILRYSAYPTYTLVQQIRITEFLDRLDLVLVTLYFPTMFSKISLFIYGSYRCIELLLGETKKAVMIPIVLTIAICSMEIFSNKAVKLDFQIYSWPMLGLILQLSIAIGVVFIIKAENKKNKDKNGGYDQNNS
ncbi:GerAB/ArcD/ProY family transporter [Evansella cellulosilytica]|uniref:Spore germination protein n=1 Tax=Evansella cellulosilytica (strain ATCC 21833 / DSM 2522 / FERM P-1141 / JCM 9156 / N-4) TaxID=649639 RepID=E6U0Z7_EVAC2|nr:endospore germination permease [Evansella cellulosilytica]ADU30309.1 spore germination protein [Evansella cellulosilytica DSM 2522]